MMGKKMMFLDVVELGVDEVQIEKTDSTITNKVHNGCGNHVRRQKVLKISDIVPDK